MKKYHHNIYTDTKYKYTAVDRRFDNQAMFQVIHLGAAVPSVMWIPSGCYNL